LGEGFDAAIQTAFADQPQRARDGVGRADPCGRSGRTFRPATEARAITCLSRSSRSWKVAAILFLGRWCGADGAAINHAAAYADKKFAVETRVARDARAGADSPIQFHPCTPTYIFVVIIAVREERCRRFRTELKSQVGRAFPRRAGLPFLERERGPETSTESQRSPLTSNPLVRSDLSFRHRVLVGSAIFS
jgi:hypothetical protein